MTLKNNIINEMKKVDREGIEDLIDFMLKSDFFVAPASRSHHLNVEGGLAKHSWNVYKAYKSLVGKYSDYLDIPEESIIIESIGHDFCKINLYRKKQNLWSSKQESYLNSLVKSNASIVAKSNAEIEFDVDGNVKPISRDYASSLISWLADNPKVEDCPDNDGDEGWEYNDTFPAGHGEKSIFLLQRFIKLKKREILAIRWHMGAYEDGVYGGYKSRDFNKSKEMFSDVSILHLADMEASIYEDLADM